MLLQFAVRFICSISTVFMSFPEIITELPTVTVTELPLDRIKSRLESVILEEIQSPTSNKSEEQQQQQQQQHEQEEQPLQPLFEAAKEVPQKDEQMPKINDPGGGFDLDGLVASAEALGAAGDDGTGNVTSEEQQTGGAGAAAGEGTTNDTLNPKANLTKSNEEVPMPVFSEWAQKQMEAEASREQAMELEQQVANNSAQRRNNTGSASGKPAPLKLRSKNYASPDCGAKIIASNGDATNTGAVLTQSSDEYMLSTCGSRLWFVVELCEAIQAQKVELANFELFSSSPKNFTVAVSKRFPTRDWSNVGRFAAEDKRTVQTFELHPHLFGKFVRVDIHSHYSKEHFCPVSLFRVFGTSEFEAFETEIRPSDELDDFDDDFGGGGQEQGGSSSHKANAGGGGGGIFQSASDAVIQMVKKAAEVLVKPTKALKWSAESLLCKTPAFGTFSCASCNSTLVQRINSLLSCQFQQLQLLLNHSQLRSDLLQSGVCQEEYAISLWGSEKSCGLAKRQSYFLSMLPAEHVGAMCKLLQAEQNNTVEQQQQIEATPELKPPPEQAQENATAASETSSGQQELIVEEAMKSQPSLEIVTPESVAASLEMPSSLIGDQSEPSATTTAATTNSTPADVNIFNVPAETEELELPVVPNQPTVSTAPVTPTLVESPSDVEATTMPPSSSEVPHNAELAIEESNPANWESLDNLLTTTVASITAGGSAAAAAAAAAVAGNGNGNHLGVGAGGAGAGGIGSNVNLQQKLTNGGQSESVFIRLSNRIKALERNMSLSGQYLEELSRRYKKQVEELQQTLTQQTLTVRSLEDQSRRYIEQEQLYQQHSAELAGEVRALSYQVQACILVIIIVGSFIVLMLVLGTVYYRKLRRQTQQLKEGNPSGHAKAAKPKLDRRKSYEQMLNPQCTPKQRRPSEEAMLILKDCGDSQLVGASQDLASRQRKISVCYGSNNNIAANMMTANPNLRASLHRRKGAKHSWHNSMDTAETTSCAAEQLDTFFDADTLKSLKQQPSSSGSKAGKRKSLQQQLALKRQESAPASMMQNELAEEEPASQSDFDESLMLDDDDLVNFIPTSDLAYNEFMPEGPSGYLVLDAVDGKSNRAEQPPLQKQATKKSRRLSSPAFFKSPFSKNKNKGGSFNGFGGIKNSHSVHESTSWEWYRLKRSEKQQQPHHHSKQTKSLPNSSLDSSSLSEVNFPLNSSSNSTQNSFRILGEAIRSSGESSSITPNGNGNTGASGSSSSGSGSNSGGSTTSSTTKKKQRAFNNIFRKVF
ncbi:SUN domain-containing ossification factor isoform X2 [Drosophila obscura]|uniref:SUN domain-containing ossification factor isoform X2 n=1 Tax=Drosophila obscura TaxID=7282 RepID=UPI001BB1AFDE|nr:SUN domain-containing ossification factor isoform X2 [Drosophila obscura]